MNVYFELLDTESGTLLKDYDTEIDALNDLQAFGREHGPEQLKGLALLRISNDLPSLIARDDALIALVHAKERILPHPRPRGTTRTTTLEVELSKLPVGKPLVPMPQAPTYAIHNWEAICVA